MALEQKITVVIPCLNEERGIKAVLKRIPKKIGQVIVVDNGSTDTTGEVSRKLGAEVIYEPKRGYGNALRAGFRAAKKKIIVTLDGDGTYPPEKIPEIAKAMLRTKADMVIADRFNKKYRNGMPSINLVGNILLTLTSKLLLNFALCDSQSGMMMFKKSILKKVRLTSSGMSLSEEIKIKTLISKFTVIEYPIKYRDKRIGNTKLHLWRDGFANLWYLIILWMKQVTKSNDK